MLSRSHSPAAPERPRRARIIPDLSRASASPHGWRNDIAAAGLAALIVVLALVIVRTAWLSDDGFVTLRTIDNFWNGYGLRWNVTERVQAYTHPLWMMLVGAAYGVTREGYFTPLIVSFLCLAGLVTIVCRRLAAGQALFVIAALASSRAFADFSTSGLENPLSHLLLAAFCLRALDGQFASTARLRQLAWLGSLCALTRLDLALIVAPAIIAEAWRITGRYRIGWRRIGWRRSDDERTGEGRAWRALAPAALPLVAWHLFTLIYYGSLLPNTAYAKLQNGATLGELLTRGWFYHVESLQHDYVTLPIIVIALVVACVRWRRTGSTMRRPARAMAVGVLAYHAYVASIGGDFMSGRYFSAPFTCAVLLLALRLPARTLRAGALSAAAVLIAGLLPQGSRLWLAPPPPADRLVFYHDVADERQFYYRFTGLARRLTEGDDYLRQPWLQGAFEGHGSARVIVFNMVGAIGYYGGPSLHVIDPMALGDPLLARLPPIPGWRIGHYARTLPEGYEASVRRCVDWLYPPEAAGQTVAPATAPAATKAATQASTQAAGEQPARPVRPTSRSCLELGDEGNRIVSPRIHALYEDVRVVTQGPLFTLRRWQAIARLLLRPTPVREVY
jgi:arabinofuranosyltransferase